MRTINVKTYKVPQDLISDILRILFANNVKHKIKSVQPIDNIISVEVDYNSTKKAEPRRNIETILEDYREYMKDVLGDAILNQLDWSEEEDED